MKFTLLALGCAALTFAAEPDWSAVEKHALDLLQRYVRIQSVNPPADTRAAAALFKTELEAVGLQPTLYQGGPNGETNLVVRLKGRNSTKKPLLLLNHFDVVPVDRAAWSMDPFGGIIRDGYIWGRGTLDMKGAGIQQLSAMIAMKRVGVVPDRDIVMLCTADEETSGPAGIKWMIANKFSEIDAEYVLDEGGLSSSDLFTPGKLVVGISVAQKQIAWMRLRAKGIAGHGSQPIAENANDILLAALSRATKLPPNTKPNAVVQAMERAVGGKFADNKFIRAIRDNTASLTTLTSGVGFPVKVNVIPSTAEATLDCRLLPGVNVDEFASEMRARINDPRVTLEIMTRSADAPASPDNTPLFVAMRKAVLKAHPGAQVTPMLIPYGIDSVSLRQKGAITYGFIPMVITAEIAATMHSDQERIPVAEFQRGIHIFYDILTAEF